MKHLPTSLLGLAAAIAASPLTWSSPQESLHDRVWSTFSPSVSTTTTPGTKDVGGARPNDEEIARQRLQNAPRATPPSGGNLYGGPFNDNCADAWTIPGGAITWNANQSTIGALGENCGAEPECVASSQASVWFEYTPDADGLVEFSTFGSNYDTVLAVFDGCGFPVGFFCNSPEQLACSDDALFGNQSQVFVSVVAGTLYKVLVAGKTGGGNLNFNFAYFPPNNVCVNATDIVGTAYDPPLLSTHNATADLCEAEENCEFNNVGVSNSVFYRFVPPCDGSVHANTNGSTYDTVLSVWNGCGQFVGIDFPCEQPDQLVATTTREWARTPR